MARSLASFVSTKLAQSMTSADQIDSIKLEALRDPLDPSATAAWPVTGPQVLRFSGTYQGRVRQELVYADSAAVLTDNTVSLGGVVRNINWKDGQAPTQLSSTGIQWTAATQVDLVADHTYLNSLAQKLESNTFTSDQTIQSGKKLYFGAGAYVWTEDDGTTLKFKDTTNTEKTLSQLAAGAGSDEKAKNSVSDTTSDFLNSKIVVTSPLAKTTLNPAGNEQLQISISTPISVANGGTGLTAVTPGSLLLGNGTGALTIIGPGSKGQAPVSDGTTVSMGSPVLFYQNTADSNDITSGTSDTAFTTGATINPVDWAVGACFDVEVFGVVDGGVNNRQLNLKLKLGSTTLVSLDSMQPTTLGTYRGWYARFKVVCRSTGATGTVQAAGRAESQSGAVTSSPLAAVSSSDATVTIDTTAAATLQITQAWNFDDGVKHCKIKNISIYRYV